MIKRCLNCNRKYEVHQGSWQAKFCKDCRPIIHFLQTLLHNTNKYFCIDCMKIITQTAKRCQKCEAKHRSKYLKGKRHHKYKNGLTKNNRCKICHKKIKWGAKHCVKCDRQLRIKGRKISSGYVYVYVNNEYILEHRLIMERYLKRKLRKKEIIHHINCLRDDNLLKNLFLCDNSKHGKIHTSLNLIIADLIANNVVKFNRKKGIYEYNKSA